MRRLTPLRYPGGKAALADFFGRVLQENRLSDCRYIEPFAGGAAVGVYLLVEEFASSIAINDIDPAVYAFWKSVLDHNEDLCDLIAKTPLTLEEWSRQRRVYQGCDTEDLLALGFSMFYLNRTNRSGIMNGGVIGGKSQTSQWGIGARFNRNDLIDRIRRIGRYRSRITVSNLDALEFLRSELASAEATMFAYLDPPYYEKGQHLYTNYFQPKDHRAIAQFVSGLSVPWAVSYDDHIDIREMYADFPEVAYQLSYSARAVRKGSEVMFFSRSVRIPHFEPADS